MATFAVLAGLVGCSGSDDSGRTPQAESPSASVQRVRIGERGGRREAGLPRGAQAAGRPAGDRLPARRLLRARRWRSRRRGGRSSRRAGSRRRPRPRSSAAPRPHRATRSRARWRSARSAPTSTCSSPRGSRPLAGCWLRTGSRPGAGRPARDDAEACPATSPSSARCGREEVVDQSRDKIVIAADVPLRVGLQLLTTGRARPPAARRQPARRRLGPDRRPAHRWRADRCRAPGQPTWSAPCARRAATSRPTRRSRWDSCGSR